MITASINAEKVDRSLFFQGQKGKYMDLVFFENKDGPDQYGNTHYVVQGVSKEQRDKGVRGPIIGNAKVTEGPSRGQRREQPRQQQPQGQTEGGGWSDDSEIPF